MIKIKISNEIEKIKNLNSEIKEVRYNDKILWGNEDITIKITYFNKKSGYLAQLNSVFIYTDKYKYSERLNSGDYRILKPLDKNGKKYVKIKAWGGFVNASLIIREKNGSWSKSLINKDEIVTNEPTFEVEIVNAADKKEYIVEIS